MLKQLQQLDSIEEDLSESLAAAGAALKELSKDKPNGKCVENFTSVFASKLEKAGMQLSQQVAYLARTTGSSNEGSSYKKEVRMADASWKHSKACLEKLEASANKLNN